MNSHNESEGVTKDYGDTGSLRSRDFSLDAARAFLMLMGIPFHAALIYSSKFHWYIVSRDQNDFYYWISMSIHAFRMPAFFVLSGYLSAITFVKAPATAWTRSRLVRLGIPLLTCAVILIPLQLGIEYLEAMKWQTDARFGWIEHLESYHLWFLADLILFTIIFALSWKFLRKLYVAALIARSNIAKVCVLIGCLLIFRFGIGVINVVTGDSLHIGNWFDFSVALTFLPFFLMGALLRVDGEFFLFLVRPRWWVPAIAVAATVLFIRTDAATGISQKTLHSMANVIAALFFTIFLITLCRRFFSSASKGVKAMVDASFSIYLFHHPIIMLLGVGVTYLAIPSAIGFVFTCVAAFLLSFGLHQLIRKNDTLLFAFNGITPKRRQPSRSLPVGTAPTSQQGVLLPRSGLMPPPSADVR